MALQWQLISVHEHFCRTEAFNLQVLVYQVRVNESDGNHKGYAAAYNEYENVC